MSGGITDPGANRLLSSLSQKEQRRLSRALLSVHLGMHEVLYEPGKPIRSIYFPKKGALISLTCLLADGKSLDAGWVGSQGMAGVEVFLGGETALFRATVL